MQNIIEKTTAPMRDIAVIGGGISGIAAAHYLARTRKVTLFEQERRIGGHTHTVHLPPGSPDAGMPVDMGFIVLNDRTYPLLDAFLDELEVPRAATEMSFAFYDRATGRGYAGTGLNGLFARRSNMLNPEYWQFLGSVIRFGRQVERDLAGGVLSGKTVGEYFGATRINSRLFQDYLTPMIGAVWSASEGGVASFPMESFARFFANHGLLTFRNRPVWRYIPGGSETYVRAFMRRTRATILTDTPVLEVTRSGSGVRVRWATGTRVFDGVVLAVHADTALRLLADADFLEQELLGPWEYARNTTVLHTDISVMPPVKRFWGAWTHVREHDKQATDSPVSIHYHMNRLQRLRTKNDYIVTLNPGPAIDSQKIIESVRFSHPQYTLLSLATQDRLHSLNGRNRTWFCGAYQFNGFHEDGIRSAIRVVRDFGETP